MLRSNAAKEFAAPATDSPVGEAAGRLSEWCAGEPDPDAGETASDAGETIYGNKFITYFSFFVILMFEI